jgi:hypothetical protein
MWKALDFPSYGGSYPCTAEYVSALRQRFANGGVLFHSFSIPAILYSTGISSETAVIDKRTGDNIYERTYPSLERTAFGYRSILRR